MLRPGMDLVSVLSAADCAPQWWCYPKVELFSDVRGEGYDLVIGDYGTVASGDGVRDVTYTQ